MTQQLYLQQPLLTSFSATVTACTKKDDGFLLELDQTAFYPEGGGQPSDQGKIENAAVTYVSKEDGHILHEVDQAFTVGDSVQCQVNWARRKELMQQHTGQHMFSAALWQLYEAKTVGFHLTDDNLTVDLDKDLSYDEILRAEDRVNEWIQSNLEIICSYPDDETLAALPLRKRPKVSHNIRVVEIKGADCTPCGAPHPPTTALLGMLKVKRIDRYKGGIRVQFGIGVRAQADYRFKNDLINDLVSTLKVQPEGIFEVVGKLLEENKAYSRRIKTLQADMASIEAEALVHDAVQHRDGFKIIRKVFEGRDFSDVRQMAAKLCEKDNIVVLFGLKEEDASRLIYSRSKDLGTLSMKDLFAPAIEKLEGRGGGSPLAAQGGGKNPEILPDVIDASMDMLLGV